MTEAEIKDVLVEALKVVDDCYTATGHFRVAKTSIQRMKIERAINALASLDASEAAEQEQVCECGHHRDVHEHNNAGCLHRYCKCPQFRPAKRNKLELLMASLREWRELSISELEQDYRKKVFDAYDDYVKQNK